MKHIRRISWGIVICASFVMIPCNAQDNVVDEVIWVVGDEPILKSDVENQRISAEMNGMSLEGNPYCVIPEQLALQKLFLHQAALDSAKVSDADVIRMVDARLNEWLQIAGSKEKLEEYRQKSMSKIREELMLEIRNQMMAESVRRKLVENVKVTPAEVRHYFKDLPNDSLPLIPTKVEVQIITHEPKVSRQEIERVEGELREYVRRINAGESDFSTLAILYSQDPGSARRGGEMDYSGKAEFVPEFANVAFSLTDPKKVSKIVKTEYGYHIIQLIDRRGDKIKVRHILRKPQISKTEETEALASLDSLASDIRDAKISFDNVTALVSDDKDTRNNKGLMVNVNRQTGTRTSLFTMQELPQDVAKVVDRMSVGEISKPFQMINEKGQEVCAIVKLKNRYDTHRANVTEDFQMLTNVVKSKRQAEIINNWIREKQKTTYIRINEGWRDCQFEYPGWIK